MINSINQNTLKMFGEQNESTCGKKSVLLVMLIKTVKFNSHMKDVFQQKLVTVYKG